MRNLFKNCANLDPETCTMLARLPGLFAYLHLHVVHLHGWHFAWVWIAG